MRKQSLQKRRTPLGWDDLRCILMVARSGSLNGAARALGIEHSTVFRRMNTIEKQLGVKLFNRTRTGYTPTEQGTTAATAAAAMEREALAVERQILGARTRLSGVVRIATTELFAAYLLPSVLAGFLTAHPDIEVEVQVSSRAVDLTRREADLAFRATNAPPDHLIGRQLGELRYAIYGASSLAESARGELEKLPWLGFDDSMSHLEIARWQRMQRLYSGARVRFSSIAPMLQATAEGLGIAVLPLFAADQHRGLVRLSQVLEAPRMQLWVLSHKDMRENARVRALSRYLARHISQLLAARQKASAG